MQLVFNKEQFKNTKIKFLEKDKIEWVMFDENVLFGVCVGLSFLKLLEIR
jgi:hypothetical protein